MPITTQSPTGPVPVLRDPGPGLVLLDTPRAQLFAVLDRLFVRLAVRLGARPVIGPPLLPEVGLASLDYFRNFPHLAVTAARFVPETLPALADGTPVTELGPNAVDRTGYVLPSATCYGLLLALQGADLPEDGLRLTAVGRCFRNETQYDGLRRLWGFHMREALYLGPADGVPDFLSASRALITELAGQLGLTGEFVAANDPFYDRGGSRAKLTALDPVKHEFVAPDGTAVASVNRHRNFFGERLGIRVGETLANSACTAFGVERWVHALLLAHGSEERALTLVDQAEREATKDSAV